MLNPANARALLLAGCLVFALAGCPKEEGPAEKAGKKIDNAAEDVGEHLKDLGDKIEDSAEGHKH